MKSQTTFKRLEVGANFSFKGENFRKSSKGGAFRLKQDGRGETHAEVKFTRSASVFA